MNLLIQSGTDRDREYFASQEATILSLGRIDSIEWLDNDAKAPQGSVALLGELKLIVPLAGLIDLEAESERLDREIAKLQQRLGKSKAKLANSGFVNNSLVRVN